MENEELAVLVSPRLLEEIHRVLEYPRLKARIKTTEAQALLDALQNDSILLDGTLVITGVTRNPKDDMVLACAVEGKTDYIVTGDPDLHQLESYQDIRIVTPTEFVAILEQASQRQE